VHAPGEADLNLYAYVHGRVYVAVDPNGLRDERPKQPTDAEVGALTEENQQLYKSAKAELDTEFSRLERSMAKDAKLLSASGARGAKRDVIAKRLASAEASWNALAKVEEAWISAVGAGDGAFTVGRVVWNEARSENAAGQTAVAYAWMNRTRGIAREPVGQEISELSTLRERMSAQQKAAPRLFVRAFATSLAAAVRRLADKQPADNDPTAGARHWISPQSLPETSSSRDRYQRDFGAPVGERSCPSWAISNDAYRALSARERSKHWGPNYSEHSVQGVSSSHFLFYTGVK
jgi:hypothetical protein